MSVKPRVGVTMVVSIFVDGLPTLALAEEGFGDGIGPRRGTQHGERDCPCKGRKESIFAEASMAFISFQHGKEGLIPASMRNHGDSKCWRWQAYGIHSFPVVVDVEAFLFSLLPPWEQRKTETSTRSLSYLAYRYLRLYFPSFQRFDHRG
jgi:hypothetical protein